MPLLLRQIRRTRWYQEAWLEKGKAQANALLDLKPEENKLSFWHIKDDQSNLHQVVAAIGAGRDVPEHLDYVLFKQNSLAKARFRIEQTIGRGFHKEANEYWHCDTTELYAEDVAEVANIIMEHGTTARIGRSKVTELARQAVASGIIDMDKRRASFKQKGLSNWLE
jgi:hypothetical protein